MFAVMGVGGGAHAKDGDKKADAPAHEVNACGCYKDTAGACFCGKGKAGKCACPGDCEPKGCEVKRQKEFDKEVAAEKKKAAEADKKQRQSSHDASNPRAGKQGSTKKSDGAGP
ncbi:MAG TPA: hypothetical protein VH560_10415 [Polyangia bacterium]|nr:hypothetical protein [Polyangia bacterium]